MAAASPCPLCANDDGSRKNATRIFAEVEDPDRLRRYFRCEKCGMSFLDPAHRLSHEAEFAHYQHHENCVDDPGYRKFLSKLFNPLTNYLASGARGLDFGAGPGPALAAMFEEAGFAMTLYDPFFHDDQKALSRTYDFIVSTETIEHLYSPRDEFERFDQLLKPGGVLGLMTCFQTDDDAFAQWHYRKDPTHVVFYKEETLRYIAASLGWRCEIIQKDVVVMFKPEK